MPLVVRAVDQGFLEPMHVDFVSGSDGSADSDFTVESTTLELETFMTNYTGLSRLHRLLFIAKHCPALELEALKLAHSIVKQTYNTQLYSQIITQLSEASARLGSHENVQVDTKWVETSNKKAAVKLEHLDSDLKTHKANTIKESIRRGHDDLGDHHLDCGDLNNALKCYSKSRDYCSMPKHVISMCLNVIKVSVLLKNWAHVLNIVNKAESSVELLREQPEKPANLFISTKLKCAAGLAELALKKYKCAARQFLQAQFDHFDYKELISAHDVALYGGLCALATFDRQELRNKVLSNSSFKLFLELDPQMRDILHKFYESQYASCLKILDDVKDNFRLNIHLSSHVNSLYGFIRNRALIQYFSPYVSADMGKMATSFNTTVSDLEDELTKLILDDQIQARIDSHNKILYARQIDQRTTTYEKAIKMGNDYEKRAKSLIIRTAVISNQIFVKSPPPRDREPTAVDSGTR
ncbi:COP9 signalosome complex subunit 1-like isoform X2 [Xenia sp. Carnegie-2017]|uniref:COP9 signalosome complex subunit 1-like isoform X1 n=1 Tax=Xenia sp. Carnegie-2017 TaxID=2897299 RepID=UPI001F048247|nr:COP9 signalosome complex subunit 1-like isoform X1 [Xenia sp. Carnegie-2017]XP_046855834.1 COP9 signalosome complex subunit 1-like isoform X2 [Xenia sp. Carnegie-2017]